MFLSNTIAKINVARRGYQNNFLLETVSNRNRILNSIIIYDSYRKILYLKLLPVAFKEHDQIVQT